MADLNYPDELKYARSDEWVRIEGDVATIGISDYAQDQMNDIVFVEYTVDVGEEVAAGTAFGSIESVKASSDIYAVIGGTVLEVNKAVESAPETVNTDPYGAGWLIKLKLAGEPDTSTLMDSAAYQSYRQE